jgi:hypothetical protein
MTEGREERVAKNQALFRQVNERVKGISEPFIEIAGSAGVELMDFVCECGRAGCHDTMPMTLDEYEQARAQPTTFAIRPGHEAADVETVLTSNERFALVEKHTDESDVARATDPRS